MIEGWEKMSALQRQDARLDAWAEAANVPFSDDKRRAEYQFRAGLFRDAIQLRKSPARVPVFLMGGFAITKLYGVSGRQAMYEPAVAAQAFVDFNQDYQPDAAVAPMAVSSGPPFESLGYTLYKWPGHGVADELSFQYVEKEYMKAEEYDHFLADPTDFWWRVWFPRTHEALAPLSGVLPVYGTMEMPMALPWLVSLGSPAAAAALRALADAAEKSFAWMQTLGPFLGKIAGGGFPGFSGGYCKAPFDVLSDTMRGTTPLMMDLYRRPAKVLAACEKMVSFMVDMGVANSKRTGNPMIFIPLHKGADGFMSNDQFAKFYWPSLKAVMYGLAENGCVPLLFVEGAYNQRLEFLAETADIRSICLFDRTDMVRAREVLGGKVCLSGGFPASLLLTGTPEQVRAETRKHLDAVKGDGGYSLTVGCSMDDVRADTLRALFEAGKEFGVY